MQSYGARVDDQIYGKRGGPNLRADNQCSKLCGMALAIPQHNHQAQIAASLRDPQQLGTQADDSSQGASHRQIGGFEQFYLLPPELRYKIYRLAATPSDACDLYHPNHEIHFPHGFQVNGSVSQHKAFAMHDAMPLSWTLERDEASTKAWAGLTLRFDIRPVSACVNFSYFEQIMTNVVMQNPQIKQVKLFHVEQFRDLLLLIASPSLHVGNVATNRGAEKTTWRRTFTQVTSISAIYRHPRLPASPDLAAVLSAMDAAATPRTITRGYRFPKADELATLLRTFYPSLEQLVLENERRMYILGFNSDVTFKLIEYRSLTRT